MPCHTQIQCPHYLVFPALWLFPFWQMKNFSTEGFSLMTRKQYRFSILLLSLHFSLPSTFETSDVSMQGCRMQRYFPAYSFPPSSPCALGSGAVSSQPHRAKSAGFWSPFKVPFSQGGNWTLLSDVLYVSSWPQCCCFTKQLLLHSGNLTPHTQILHSWAVFNRI